MQNKELINKTTEEAKLKMNEALNYWKDHRAEGEKILAESKTIRVAMTANIGAGLLTGNMDAPFTGVSQVYLAGVYYGQQHPAAPKEA